MLIELLKGHICFIDKADNWKEAVLLASKPLLNDQSITINYVQSMIDMCERYSGYIVLADYFAMPHASSEMGVNKLAASLLIIKESVNLFDNQIHIILPIAPIDHSSHLNLLQEIALFFSDDTFIQSLIHSSSEQEVIEVFRMFERKEEI